MQATVIRTARQAPATDTLSDFCHIGLMPATQEEALVSPSVPVLKG
jgi:hypothetical protein